MSTEIAGLLESGKVIVWSGTEQWRVKGMDVIHGELHLTVGPAVKESKLIPWFVAVAYDGPNIFGLAVSSAFHDVVTKLDPPRASVVEVWRVDAVDEKAARLTYVGGKRLANFVWLGT